MSSESPLKQDIGYVAPVHVVMGMAGMGLSQNMVSPKPEWVEYATDREYGLGLIVANETKLQLTFVLDSDGQVRVTYSGFLSLFDSVLIFKRFYRS